jgi:hypothetical protein
MSYEAPCAGDAVRRLMEEIVELVSTETLLTLMELALSKTNSSSSLLL